MTSPIYYTHTSTRDGRITVGAQTDTDGTRWVICRLPDHTGNPVYAVRLAQTSTADDATTLMRALVARLKRHDAIAWNLVDAAIVDAFPLSDDHTRRLNGV